VEITALEAENDRLKTELEALRQARDEYIKAEGALKKDNALLRQIIDALPVGITVCDAQGQFTLFSRAVREMAGSGATDTGPEGWSDTYGVFKPDGVTPYPSLDLPISRALRGEDVTSDELIMRNPKVPEGVWISTDARPLHDESGAVSGAVSVTRDVTEHKQLTVALSKRNAALQESETEKANLIARLRLALRDLSAPILEVWDDVLALPIIGVVDSQRSSEMTARLLEEVSRSQVRFVILDLTGVDIIDTSTADNFIKLVKSVELLGARAVLTGIRPAVAQALVSLDTGFDALTTLHNLKHGLRECMRWLNEGLERRSTAARLRSR
jgi:rsbT co-antagonist protein RsbR